MVTAVLYFVKNLWPFSALKSSDLRVSDGIVRKLSLPEHTKEFIFAIPVPESGAVVYVLCAQNLSERSALDAEFVIREIKPDAVVVQVGHGVVDEVQSGEIKLINDVEDDHVPTSSFEVLKRCFIQKLNKDSYENVAGNLVLKEIFGIHLHGHLLAAKKAAEAVGSSFLLLESPFVKRAQESNPISEAEPGNMFQALAMKASRLVPQKVGSVVSSSSRRFSSMNDLQLQTVKSLGLYFPQLNPMSNVASGEVLPRAEYEAPSFARSVYPLLVDLHDIFIDIPSIGSGLAHAQKLLDDVSKGKVDIKHLSEVYIFQIAVEGLRIALNNAGRLPINSMKNSSSNDFAELDVEEKSHALLAEALKSQTRKFKSVVAVVDASGLAGLRKHWNVVVPSQIKGMVEQLITDCDSDDESSNNNGRKRLLTSKPVVAVGAGATAVLGASSLSKFAPASSIMKVVTFKCPTSLKLLFTQSQKVITMALSKSVGPSKVMGAKTSSVLKASASAEKIRAVAHSVIASAEKTSFSAMRTSFYEIMRKRRIIRQIGVLPWATFGLSIATCSSLLMYGDRIECVAESFPAAPSIASLGRGIQSLHQASEAVRQAESSRIQKSIESLMYRLNRVKTK